jgi:hypothetical protein
MQYEAHEKNVAEPCTAAPPIMANIDILRDSVRAVCQRVIVLEERLSPVLTPEPPKASGPCAKERFGASPVCDDLHSI